MAPTKNLGDLHIEAFWKTAVYKKSLQNRWLPAQEWVRNFRYKQNGVKYTVVALNAAMRSRFYHGSWERDDLGLQVLFNWRGVRVQTESGAARRTRYFYFVKKFSATEELLQKIPTVTAPYQKEW